MAGIDWDAAVESYRTGPQFKATPEGIVETPPPTPLPEIMGTLGGVAGALLTKSPAGATAGRSAVMEVGRRLVPSLFGSTVGTAVGLGAEAAFQPVSPERAMSSVLENAAWDVGGNLIFMAAGKTVKLGKEVLEKAGITRASTFDDAKLAAQEFLSQRGATLTRGQMTGGNLDTFIEEISRGGTGSKLYEQQQEKVGKAVLEGTQAVKSALDTSDAFKQALSSGEPLTRAAGENFQNLITTARESFKEAYRPFYQNLSTDLNASVDLRPLKRQAEAEMARLEKSKFAGAGADRRTVLDDILKQDDLVDFGVAHDLRSNFGAAARDKIEAGGKTTALSAAYSKAESDITNAMDSAFSYKRKELAGTPYTQKLVNDYKNTQSAYREGMNSLYNATITKGMEAAPSKVGAYVFDLAETEKATDLYKAITAADKYAKGTKNSSQVMNDFKYGFLEQSLATPEKIKKFSTALQDDPEMNRAFYKLFASEAKPLKEVLNAADFGLENQKSNIAAFLKNKAAITTGQVGVGALGYLALPADLKEGVSDKLPAAVLTAGAFVLTPRFLAKAATNREAVNALAGLAKGSKDPSFKGAAAAKFIDQLNKSGVIDSEYINEIDALFGNDRQTQQPVPQTEQPINWDSLVK
jgi:hypothetical protein